MSCPLCLDLENTIYEDDFLKVVLVDKSGYVRVITQKHIKELSELSEEEAIRLLKAIRAIEKVMIDFIKPDKVNIASFGNQVPHLHIHIIPRYKDDEAWPGSSFCIENFKTKEIDTTTYIKELKKCLNTL